MADEAKARYGNDDHVVLGGGRRALEDVYQVFLAVLQPAQLSSAARGSGVARRGGNLETQVLQQERYEL